MVDLKIGSVEQKILGLTFKLVYLGSKLYVDLKIFVVGGTIVVDFTTILVGMGIDLCGRPSNFCCVYTSDLCGWKEPGLGLSKKTEIYDVSKLNIFLMFLARMTVKSRSTRRQGEMQVAFK